MYVCLYVCIKNPLFKSTSSIAEKNNKTFSKELGKKSKLLQHITMHVLMRYTITENSFVQIQMKKAWIHSVFPQGLGYFSTVSEHLLRKTSRISAELNWTLKITK